MGSGSSPCVSLSRAVLPGFAAAGKGGRVLVPVVSASFTRRCGTVGGVACCSTLAARSFCRSDHGAGDATSAAERDEGIGVAEFLGGKNFLITGGTGFLAKVLIEKILRTNPDVGKIYVLIKATGSVAALKRLQNEVVDTDLFKCLQDIHGKDYDAFVARKLVPVVGDVRETNIGIAPALADEIADEVDVIINSAANTTFDERYDVAMDINTVGPFRIMSFAQRFRRLKLFVQVSTAYVNGQRQGLVQEKPFRMGDTIAKELGSSEHQSVVLDIEEEMKLAFHSRRHSDDSASFAQQMKELGLERAKLHGWQDTYVFTKAMGEMVINCMRGEIPVVTIRPSVIESTWRDPFPGWMEGNRMMDPVVLYYGKGQLTGFLADPDGILDVVPADMVVNATLASMARHGGAASAGPGMHVYHVSSSTVNPLVFGDLSRFLFQHFSRCPYSDAAGSRSGCRRCGCSTAWSSSRATWRRTRCCGAPPWPRRRPPRTGWRSARATSAPSPWSRPSTWAASTSPTPSTPAGSTTPTRRRSSPTCPRRRRRGSTSTCGAWTGRITSPTSTSRGFGSTS